MAIFHSPAAISLPSLPRLPSSPVKAAPALLTEEEFRKHPLSMQTTTAAWQRLEKMVLKSWENQWAPNMVLKISEINGILMGYDWMIRCDCDGRFSLHFNTLIVVVDGVADATNVWLSASCRW